MGIFIDSRHSTELTNSRRSIARLALAIACLLACVRVGFSQPVNASQARLDTAAQFERSLDEITARWRVAIVAEGRPITGPVQDAPSAITKHDSVDDAVRRMATAFDYDATRSEQVFVLRKRFTSRWDIPDVSLEEIRDSLLAVSRLVAPFDPGYHEFTVPASPRGAAMAAALTPDQLAGLSQDGVPVSTLSPSQRSEVWRFAMSFYIQDIKDIIKSARYVESICRHDPNFHWGQIAGSGEFGFDVKMGAVPRTVLLPLSHLEKLVVSEDGKVTRIEQGTRLVNGVAQGLDPDSTDPALAKDLLSLPPVKETLNTVIAMLNARGVAGEKCRVDETFGPKSVTVSGAASASPSRIMLAMADVYGLEVRHTHDGVISITHKSAPTTVNLDDLAGAISKLVPPSTARAIHARLADTQSPKFGKNPDATRIFLPLAARQLRFAAATQLRAVAQPIVARSPRSAIRLSQLPTEENNVYAVSQAIEALAPAIAFTTIPLPPFISHFDNIILKGGMKTDNKGASRLSLFLSYRDPDTGQIYQGVGISNALIPAAASK